MTLFDTISAILGLIPLNSNDTTTIPPPDYTSSFIFKQDYVVCLIGIPLNLFVMYLSFLNKSIKNNYKYLLGNVAICDILFLGSILNYNLVHVYVIENDLMYTPLLCTVYRIWNQTFAVCYFNSQPLVSINRYVIIVRQNEDIFTNRVIICTCLLVYWPILYPILAFASPTYLVRDMFCGYMYWFPLIREFMLIPAGILNLVSVFCIVKLYLFLREHMRSIAILQDMTKMKDERSLLIALTVEGILPIVACLPIVIMNIIGALFNNWNEMNQPWHIFGIVIYAPYLNSSVAIFQLCPVVDPLLTILCVRQYRRIITSWCQKRFQRMDETTVSEQRMLHVNNHAINHQRTSEL